MSDDVDSSAGDRDAVDWVILFDKGDVEPSVQAEFDAWLATDRRRRGAFLRAEAAWAMMDRAQVLSNGASITKPPDRLLASLARRYMIGGSVAAGLILALVGALPQAKEMVYRTGPTEIRRVQLADGSTAALNAGTVLAVSFDVGKRRLQLSRGEAWFQVAHDASHPFVVETGRVRIQAIGTAFSVKHGDVATDLVVTEGVVTTWLDHDQARLRATAGTRVHITANGAATTTHANAGELRRELAWREEQLALDGETLTEAVAAFNRYNARKLVIGDPALANTHLIGWFNIKDPDSFAKAAAGALGARIATDGDRIVLTRQSTGRPSAGD